MFHRRFLCEHAGEQGHPFPEFQGFAYTAWAYSHSPDAVIDVIWVRCELAHGDSWIVNWTLSESDTMEFRRLARLGKSFRRETGLPEFD